MSTPDPERLRSIKTFASLVKYLRDELDWPIDSDDFDDLTFDYQPEELGLDAKTAVKIREIKQLRPLVTNQPWGIFFLNFEPKRLPVVVLRRILRALVLKKRQSANRAHQATWQLNDLLFISSYGEAEHRDITFAHFCEEPATGDLPSLKVLGWDDEDTVLHLAHAHKTLEQKLRWPGEPADLESWRSTWSAAFTLRHREVITTSKALAVRLAELATAIRKRVNRVLAVESERGPLRKLHAAFKEALIHDLTEDDFSDMYAQTITYGLLSARVSRPTGLIAENVADMVPVTNPFLRDMLSTFLTVGGRKGTVDFDELGINDVVQALRDANMEAALRDFGDKNPEEDPVVHFYELFLKEYDPRKRMQRGVFYTPRPVVSFIVRSVDEILRTEFGLADGLADITTWGEMVKRHPGITLPKGAKADQPFVHILDPACGTGTFLVEVIDTIHKTMTGNWRKQGHMALEIPNLWNEYVSDHLLPRLYGFELMMAPYAVAHMKIGLKLHETGYDFRSHERARVYLTNTLEEPKDFSDRFEFDAPALAHEAHAVNVVKRSSRFTVVIGNPPYANFGQLNRIPFILDLLEDYKRGLHEKKLNLDDDFIKFLRLAQYVMESAECGVLGFITNNTYLNGITHRQMRNAICTAMSTVRVLDLHGSAAKKEKCPDGSRDANVFDIQQGVSISLWTRFGEMSQPAGVLHADLWGSRDAKYLWLLQHAFGSTVYRKLSPTEPYHFFVPKHFELAAEYQAGASLTEMFDVNANGVKTDRDELFFGHTRQDVATRMRVFFSPAGATEPFKSQFRVENSSSYPLIERRAAARFDDSCIRQCLYRPFDMRWLYYSVGITSRPAWDVMRHMLPRHSLGLLAMRQYEYAVPEYCYFLATRTLTECRIFISNRGIANCFPLYLASEGASTQGALLDTTGRRSNLRADFLDTVARTLKLRRNGEHSAPSGLTPEDIFQYAYAIFHSPTYRTRYADFLKMDFPRLPLTSSLELFRVLARLGGELVALHLLESPKPDEALTSYTGPAHREVEKVCYTRETVWLDKAQTIGFHGVPEAVWNFHIGGYQVCEKWLKDRKGRTLSEDDIAHYQKIVVALAETIRLMKEIDEVIEQHGGWPKAFVTGREAKAEASR